MAYAAVRELGSSYERRVGEVAYRARYGIAQDREGHCRVVDPSVVDLRRQQRNVHEDGLYRDVTCCRIVKCDEQRLIAKMIPGVIGGGCWDAGALQELANSSASRVLK